MVTNEFKKNVGQVVNGNATNTNPQANAQGNVVNLNIGTSPKEPVKTITNFQYHEIKKKIREVMVKLGKSRAGNGHLVYYRKVFNHFSINETMELPADKFQEAMEFIDSFVGGVNKVETVDIKPEPILPSKSQPMPITKCVKCEDSDRRVHTIRSANRILLGLLILLVTLFAWAILRKPNPEQVTEQNVQQTEPCLFNGISHSAGAKIKMADNQLHECTTKGTWQKLSANKEKTVQKRVKVEDDF